jgi:hypothetical protein
MPTLPWSIRRFRPEAFGKQFDMGGGGGGFSPPRAPSMEMLQELLSGIQGGEQDYRKWMSGMVGDLGGNARSQLAGTMGSQLARTNVAVPVGMGALANKYTSGLDDSLNMLLQLINKPSPYGQNLSQAMSLGQGLMPSLRGGSGNMLEQLRRLLGGGGR